jgi:putative salt-induced outer membrane protein
VVAIPAEIREGKTMRRILIETPRWRALAVSALIAFAPIAPAHADPIPPRVLDMILSSAEHGDPELSMTVKVAKRTNPRSAREIERLAARLSAENAARQRARLMGRSFFEGWKGQGEIGASDTTGNTRSTSLALGLNYARDGLYWDHTLTATADYQRDNGVESKSRYFASYAGHYNVTPRFYALGLMSWEKDRFAGFDRRFSESVGLGYNLLKTTKASLALEAGPALRQTNYVTGDPENKFAGRTSVNFRWDILPKLTFTEVASFYTESSDSTSTSDTGLTAGLIGSLSVRLSYHLQYESSPPPGLAKTDSTTRLTLVYDF